MVECLLDVEKVSGSSPLSSTNKTKATTLVAFLFCCRTNGPSPLLQSNRVAQVALATWRKKNALHFLSIFLTITCYKLLIKSFLIPRMRHSFAVRYRPLYALLFCSHKVSVVRKFAQANLAKEKCFAFFVYLLNYHLLQVVD